MSLYEAAICYANDLNATSASNLQHAALEYVRAETFNGNIRPAAPLGLDLAIAITELEELEGVLFEYRHAVTRKTEEKGKRVIGILREALAGLRAQSLTPNSKADPNSSQVESPKGEI